MKVFPKPNILLSSCIAQDACRYDGSSVKCLFVEKLKPYVHFLTVCPEVGSGLSTPRQALRIILSEEQEKVVFSKTGEDVTDKMLAFSDKYIKELGDNNLHGVILKSRSPSCGLKDVKIYKSYGKSPSLSKKTSGIFAQKILGAFGQLPIETEGRLNNYNIREHFLTRIFTLAEFEKIKQTQSIKALNGFQNKNKYLLMAYSPPNLKKLGKIIANAEELEIQVVMEQYEYYLNKALALMPSTMRNINMLLHLFGYFSKDLSKEEKAFFLDELESYRNKKVPFSVPLAIIHAWAIRFHNPYLINQTIFEAFPKGLIEVTDSGKGI